MKSLLMRHKPSDADKAKWTETWNNSSYVLQPLADAIAELKSGKGSVKWEDFDTTNHYAKLISELAYKAALDMVLSLLPDTVDRK